MLFSGVGRFSDKIVLLTSAKMFGNRIATIFTSEHSPSFDLRQGKAPQSVDQV
jgi:hypothetical protein